MKAPEHPYQGLPARQFWKNEPGIQSPELFDPVGPVSFQIARDEPVVTAGSCFAQHVAKRLAASGFNFLVTEKAHPIIPPAIAAAHHYGAFSARYGNVYTARQLWQLLMEAYGKFKPAETVWRSRNGAYVDPFRPNIQPDGFASEAELKFDREVHLAAVRTAIETMSIFVFTLGLTEAWVDKRDGAVYPLAPGVVGGTFNASLYGYTNYTVDDVSKHTQACIDFIRRRNPDAKFIFTVSPVPLNATAEDKHVFTATLYSKSVLRVAAEQVTANNPFCDYFPSYEIITSPFSRGQYYGADGRDIRESGVDHVMKLFFRHYGGQEYVRSPGETADIAQETATSRHVAEMEKLVSVLCDEEFISG